MKYLFGAFGTNNVGDEAIFEGASIIYPGSTEIYVNTSKRKNSVWYADLLTGRAVFENTDELIMGGGGLIHCKGAVEDYTRMGQLAKSQGLKFSIQRVGFEAIKPEWEDATKDLLKEADSVIVRSKRSKEIVNSLGFDCEVMRDFAYEYNPELLDVSKYFPNNGKKNIGVALSYKPPEQLKEVAVHMRTILKYANIIFIPHSRAYVSYKNNDVVNGHILWSMSTTHANKETEFVIIPDILSPQETLSIYSKLDGVLANRYHSYIFAEKMNKPLLVKGSGPKTDSFINERSDAMFNRFSGNTEDLSRWVRRL